MNKTVMRRRKCQLYVQQRLWLCNAFTVSELCISACGKDNNAVMMWDGDAAA
jgi:hypothetical protein